MLSAIIYKKHNAASITIANGVCCNTNLRCICCYICIG
jgi:hypothetical protein